MMCLTFGVYSFQVTLGPLTITETESAFEVCYMPFVDFFIRLQGGLTAEYPATLKLYPKFGGYVNTRRSHMGTGYQFRVTYFKMLCRICKKVSEKSKLQILYSSFFKAWNRDQQRLRSKYQANFN